MGYQPYGAVAREIPVDVALGVIDAFEVFCTLEEASLDMYYRFLNCGFPLAISAGTDAFLNYKYSNVTGGERVYVRLKGKLTQPNWAEALRQGRSFGTNGPMLFFQLDGFEPGRRIVSDKSGLDLRADVEALSWLPLHRLEIVANGKVVEAIKPKADKARVAVSRNLRLEESAWVAARLYGPPNRLIVNCPSPALASGSPESILLAHTTPVYVELGGRKITSPNGCTVFRRLDRAPD
jgi:hypothetical protein